MLDDHFLMKIIPQVRAGEHSGWTEVDYTTAAIEKFAVRRENENVKINDKFDAKLKKWEDLTELEQKKVKKPQKPKHSREGFAHMHCYDVLKASSKFMRVHAPPRSHKRQRVLLPSSFSSDNAATQGY